MAPGLNVDAQISRTLRPRRQFDRGIKRHEPAGAPDQDESKGGQYSEGGQKRAPEALDVGADHDYERDCRHWAAARPGGSLKR
jgi:hypothetical protein